MAVPVLLEYFPKNLSLLPAGENTFIMHAAVGNHDRIELLYCFVPFAPLPDLPDERVEGVDDALARLGRRHQQRATVELGQALGLLVVNLARDWVVIEVYGWSLIKRWKSMLCIRS